MSDHANDDNTQLPSTRARLEAIRLSLLSVEETLREIRANLSAMAVQPVKVPITTVTKQDFEKLTVRRFTQ